MKKYSIVLLLCLQGIVAFGQDPEIKTDLPTIIPPSPTVAALMKFEEVPVSNYTGVPDISIPLFSTATRSKDINLDLSLKYHAGVGANDVAGDVGLGWSLFIGGTISRTVRGLPDEELVLDSGNPGKVGLYHTSLQNHTNYYYQYKVNPPLFVSNNLFEGNKYIWDIIESKKYDTEHDLWQFNFMGQSGRFYIEKDINTNLLKIVPLDDYRIKIINHYTTVGINNFMPASFTIYDEKGYRYEFDVIETTKNSTAVNNVFVLTTASSISTEKEFRSAFHLSKIFDNNDNLLVDYIFNPTNEFIECSQNSSYTANDYSEQTTYANLDGYQLMAKFNCFQEFEPIQSTVTNYSKTTVKKIQTINVQGISKIDIGYLQGRMDTNIALPNKAIYMNEMTIKTWSGETIKKYHFNYDYSLVIENRMILKEVSELNQNNAVKGSHKFYYKTNDNLANQIIGKDYWGYFNLIPTCSSMGVHFSNEPSPSFGTTDLLQKIKYPTGGSAIFNFEANRYSYVGNQALINFEENPDNLQETFYNPTPGTFNSGNSLYSIPVATKIRKVLFTPSIVVEDIANSVDTFLLQKFENGNWKGIASLHCSGSNQNCCIPYTLEANIQYRIFRSFTSTDTVPNATLGIQYFEQAANPKMFLYGGGNRIKQIGYFDTDVPQVYYDDPSLWSQYTSRKEKKYNYSWPDNANKSSGSLTFLKPLFKYQNSTKMYTSCQEPPYFSTLDFNGTVYFTTQTNFNNLNFCKTQGSDVGYKHVFVSETGNGSSVFEYTSPIDFPEEFTFTDTPPFLPTKNLDYKRGLLVKETIKNETDKLQETTYSYDFTGYETTYGIRFYKPNGLGFKGSFFNSYESYLDHLENPVGPVYIPGRSGTHFNNFNDSNLYGYPADYSQIYSLTQAYGWAKLTTKTTKNYMYNSSTPIVVQTNETFTYNTLNKKIASQTSTNSKGEILKSDYSYHTGNSVYSQNRISEIEKVESYRGSALLSTSKINYSTAWTGNVSYLPQSVAASKKSQTLETQFKYNSYDEFGNPLEVQQENGTKIAYIWGYNKTQPIAKIENAAYADVQSYVSNLQSLSDTGTEANLLTALSNLRAALPAAMVTTYTYKPLIGISTMTDPKGFKTTYEYDAFNRLFQVKNHTGKVLSKNEYNYRPN
ncbi:hypothetical protein [Flavobacterium sp.]|uniref:hypothetical protein n=1 Tax=Flavobacterium sp. TaxID=239 RepID=UPI003D6A576E